MPRILASIRSADLNRLSEELAALGEAGIDGLHVDVMDGRLVEEECFSPQFVRELRQCTALLVDVHLLVQEPQYLIGEYAAAGADRICFHLETVTDPARLLLELRTLGVVPGIACFPSTSLLELRELLPLAGLVNPLGVDPRYKQGFSESTYDRLRTLADWRAEAKCDFVLQADGGVWAKTRDALVSAGAEELVGGYPIFSAQDYAAAIRTLRSG